MGQFPPSGHTNGGVQMSNALILIRICCELNHRFIILSQAIHQFHSN